MNNIIFIVSYNNEPIFVSPTFDEASKMMNRFVLNLTDDTNNIYRYFVTKSVDNSLITIERQLKHACGPIYSCKIGTVKIIRINNRKYYDFSSSEDEKESDEDEGTEESVNESTNACSKECSKESVNESANACKQEKNKLTIDTSTNGLETGEFIVCDCKKEREECVKCE